MTLGYSLSYKANSAKCKEAKIFTFGAVCFIFLKRDDYMGTLGQSSLERFPPPPPL